jgi:GNAT superfamily N-acetyltransferase
MLNRTWFLLSLFIFQLSTLSYAGFCQTVVPLPEAVLFQDFRTNVQLVRRHSTTEADFAFLNRIVWGTNGVLYRQLDSHSYLGASSPIEIYSLESILKPGDPLGIYALYPKRVGLGDANGENTVAYYRSYLAVDESIRGRGFGKTLTGTAYQCMMDTLGKQNGFCYGYIEAENENSLRLSRANGNVELGSFQTVFFNRVRHRIDPRVILATLEQRVEITNLLKHQYRNYALTDFEYSVRPENYYVITDARGTILAGLQANKHHWAGERLPAGPLGWLALNVPPLVPFMRTRLNLASYDFIRLGNIYYAPGQLRLVQTLIETVMAQLGVYHAQIFTGGRTSPLYQDLKSLRLGPVNALLETEVKLMGRFSDPEDPRLNQIIGRPILPSIEDN